MLKKRREKSRRTQIVRNTCKSNWIGYEWQKKRLSHCPRKYEAEARKVAEILGL